jgi:hypothetical protein
MKPVQTATAIVSLKKARTMNGDARRAVVASYLMTTTTKKS